MKNLPTVRNDSLFLIQGSLGPNSLTFPFPTPATQATHSQKSLGTKVARTYLYAVLVMFLNRVLQQGRFNRFL